VTGVQTCALPISLEKFLGVKLYESRGGKVRLTEAGQRTKDLATRLFDELAEFEEAIGDEESRGTVVLSAETGLLHYHLPKIVDSFARAHRHARLRLFSRKPDETIELVRRNEADLGIVAKGPMPSELKFHPWRVFKSYILIPRGHPLARHRIPTIQDILNEETLLRYPQVVAEIDNRGQPRVREQLERVPGEFLTRPEILVKCVRVRTTETYLSTWPGRINRLARVTQKPRISAAIEVLKNPHPSSK
jgi:DNA-binding transcriptional LysR family regulator